VIERAQVAEFETALRRDRARQLASNRNARATPSFEVKDSGIGIAEKRLGEFTGFLWSRRRAAPTGARNVAERERDLADGCSRSGTHAAHVEKAVDESGEAAHGRWDACA
jgi:hypothetical protein